MIDYMTAGAGGESCLLLGRRTYQTMAATWPHMPEDNPFTGWINAMPKYVASTTLTAPLEWNATLLEGDVATAVAAVKEGDGPDLTVLGSGEPDNGRWKATAMRDLGISVGRFSLVEGRQKLRNLRRDPRLSVVVIDPTRTTHYVELALLLMLMLAISLTLLRWAKRQGWW